MIFTRNISRGVMKVIKEKVATAQKNHDAECDMLDEQCESEIESAKGRAEEGKRISEQKHIESIIGKLI